MLRMSTQRHQSTTQRGSPPSRTDDVERSQIDCLVLSGGQGTRLQPLTLSRCKPGIPFGGYYRLIDIALANAIGARCRKIFVVTQFLSSSIHQHIYRTYRQQAIGEGSIEILTAEQRPSGQNWFLGTADAIRQNRSYLEESPAEYFLILSGDQLYNIDFSDMFRFAQKTKAGLVIASLPVDASRVSHLGLMKVNDRRLVKDFYEKPTDPAIVKHFACSNKILENCKAGSEIPLYLASMGIYLFKREALFSLLHDDPREDFGKHLIPTQIHKGGCYAYLYDGYWEDIGTIDAYYHANIALTRTEPAFSCYAENLPLSTLHEHLPPAKLLSCRVNHSIICDGSIVEGDEVVNSILGPRTVVRRGSVIQDSYIMGNDSYVNQKGQTLQIGRNCLIRKAIIDINVRLGDHVGLINSAKINHYDGDGIHIREGIIIVTRGAYLPDGFTL